MSETWQRKKENGIIILFSLCALSLFLSLTRLHFMNGARTQLIMNMYSVWNVVIRCTRAPLLCLRSFILSHSLASRDLGCFTKCATSFVCVRMIWLVGGLFGESKICLYILGYGDDNCCCWLSSLSVYVVFSHILHIFTLSYRFFILLAIVRNKNAPHTIDNRNDQYRHFSCNAISSWTSRCYYTVTDAFCARAHQTGKNDFIFNLCITTKIKYNSKMAVLKIR